jgi:AbrB family looped-hinge helix DNA binding protein
MALVTVKDKYQVVIPQDVRRQLGISRGDLLEAKVERGKLTYIPKTVLNRVPANSAERRQFFKQLRQQAPEWLKETWAASKRRGADKLSMRQINDEIAAAKRQPKPKKTKSSSK